MLKDPILLFNVVDVADKVTQVNGRFFPIFRLRLDNVKAFLETELKTHRYHDASGKKYAVSWQVNSRAFPGTALLYHDFRGN